MPTQVAISLSVYGKALLQKNLRRRTTFVRLKEGLQIILLVAEPPPHYRIVTQLRLDVNTVGRWRDRYAAEGHAGIEKDRPRGANHGGKDTVDQPRIPSRVINTKTQQKPPGATHWSVRSSGSLLGRDAFTRRPRPARSRTQVASGKALLTVSNDPHFEAKLHDMAGVYMDPADHAVVFCVDEKSSIQALDRTQPGLALEPGRCGTTTHDYKCHGTSTLLLPWMSSPAKSSGTASCGTGIRIF